MHVDWEGICFFLGGGLVMAVVYPLTGLWIASVPGRYVLAGLTTLTLGYVLKHFVLNRRKHQA